VARSRSLAVRFCRALSEETDGRLLRWASITSAAKRLGIDQEEAEALAADLDDASLVRVGGGHSVILEEAGRQLAKDAAKPGPSLSLKQDGPLVQQHTAAAARYAQVWPKIIFWIGARR